MCPYVYSPIRFFVKTVYSVVSGFVRNSSGGTSRLGILRKSAEIEDVGGANSKIGR